MNTISVRHGLGPLQTTDAAFSDDAQRVLLGIKNNFGILDQEDLDAITAILEKYSASTVVGAGGSARIADARDAGKLAGAKVRANIEHNQMVSRSYASFWKEKNAEMVASSRR